MLSQSELTGYIPAGLADGDTSTYGWHTDRADPDAWLSVDFGAPRRVTQVNAYRVIDSTGYSIAYYFVQYSDDAAQWRIVGNLYTADVGWNCVSWHDAGAHRYWRLSLANRPGQAAWLSELEFLSIGRVQTKLTLSEPMLTQSGMAGYIASGIIDGDTNSYGWNTDSSLGDAWVGVDMGSSHAIAEIGVYRVQDTSENHTAQYQPQYSDDALVWANIGPKLRPLQIGWNRIGLPDNGTHRYWRLKLENSPGPSPWISELELASVE